MPRHWKTIGLFLLTSAIFDGIAAFAVVLERPAWGNPTLFDIALLALMSSQTSLASIWVGRTPSPLRMAGAISIIMLLSGAPLFVSHRYHGRVVLLLGIGGIVALCLLAARTCGLRCVHDLDRETSEVGSRWQFSIVHLLAWTAALAVVLGLFKWAGFFDRFAPELSMSLALMVFLGPGRALVAFAALWSMLGRGMPIHRSPALVIAEIVSLGLPSVLFQMPRGHELITIVFFMATEAAVFAGSLLVFRSIGYRVRWSSRSAATESSERPPRSSTEQEQSIPDGTSQAN